MARYIDADEFYEGFCIYAIGQDKNFIKAVEQVLEDTPTADVEEVKHGEWLKQEDMFCGVYYTCSHCRNDWTTIDGTPQENFMNYCPNCGAKMNGERK